MTYTNNTPNSGVIGTRGHDGGRMGVTLHLLDCLAMARKYGNRLHQVTNVPKPWTKNRRQVGAKFARADF